MKNKIVQNIIYKLEYEENKKYTIEGLKEFCMPQYIPKEFLDSNEFNDELKSFSLGCELIFMYQGEKYNGDNQQIKEVGVYHFLQATLQDSALYIIGDRYYLISLLELYGKDIEGFNKKLKGSTLDLYSTVGLVRDINQDSIRVLSLSNRDIFILADGVGGGTDGENASRIACDSAIESLKIKIPKYLPNYLKRKVLINSLKSAIMVANSAILEYAKVDSIETIGTTLTIAMVYNGHLFIAHVGDSRVYKIDKAKKAIQLTQDHSLPEVLFRNGDIAIEDKKNYKKNILLYVVGTENLKKENIDVFYHGKLKRDDTIFLCSDGVWDIDGVEDRLLDNAEDLKRYILNSTPSDNASFIRYRYKGN